MKKLSILLLISALFLSACSNDANNKPSKEDLKKPVRYFFEFGDADSEVQASFSDEQVVCIVDGIYNKFSIEGLEQLSQIKSLNDVFDYDEKISKRNQKIFDEVSEKCLTDEDNTPEPIGKSSTTTNLMNAVSATRAIQAANGSVDFKDITLASLKNIEPSILFVQGVLPSEADESSVALLDSSDSLVVLQARSSQECFFVALSTGKPATVYAKTELYDEKETCPPAPREWNENQNVAWR